MCVNVSLFKDDFASYEVNDPFTQNFIANLEKSLSSLKVVDSFKYIT